MDRLYKSWNSTLFASFASLARFSQAVHDLLQWGFWYFDEPWVDPSGRTQPIESYAIDGGWHIFGFVAFASLGLLFSSRGLDANLYNSLCAVAYCVEEIVRATVKTASDTAAALGAPEANLFHGTVVPLLGIFPLYLKNVLKFIWRHPFPNPFAMGVFQFLKHLIGPVQTDRHPRFALGAFLFIAMFLTALLLWPGRDSVDV